MDIKCVFYENIYIFISLDGIVSYIGIVQVYLNLLMYTAVIWIKGVCYILVISRKRRFSLQRFAVVQYRHY